jgi:[ribosomal protein S5]-alanine N-acetyltransferase
MIRDEVSHSRGWSHQSSRVSSRSSIIAHHAPTPTPSRIHRVHIATTERTQLRELEQTDAAFMVALLNQPSFLHFIGDRGVRTEEAAASFIESRYRQSYRDHGYGLYLVELRDSGTPIGICGFVRRDGLDGPDLGFAFLPEFEGRGYAYETSVAALEYARTRFDLSTLLAIVQPDNVRSHRLVARLGFRSTGVTTLPGATQPVEVYAFTSDAAADVVGASEDATGHT